MAVCLKCHHPMKQTEPTCPKCGEDYLDDQPGRWHVLFHQSSLKDLFYVVSVMGLFFALMRWLIPFLTFPLGPYVLGFALGGCALLLGKSAPFWSRVFSLAAIIGFLYYPLMAIFVIASWHLTHWLRAFL